MTADTTQDHRWTALYVLCAGVLMIVLDATIVNVALPSIQDDLGFSQIEPRLGGQRLPDRVRRPAAARRPARRPARPAARLPGRARGVHRRLGALRALADRGDADRRALRPGGRRRDVVGGGARDDRDDVPRAARAGEGDRRLRLRRLGRRLDRAARRRRPHRRDQLALDLLHQRPDRDRDRDPRPAAGRGPPRDRLGEGRRPARRDRAHERADDRRLRDPPGLRAGLDLVAGARPDRRLVAAGRIASSSARPGSRTR